MLSHSSEDVKMWLVLKLSTVVWTLAQSVLTVMTKGCRSNECLT